MQHLTPSSKMHDIDPMKIRFDQALLEKEEYFSRIAFSKLIENNFNQGHDYVMAFIEDEEGACTAHDGACVSRAMAQRIGNYSPETSKKIANIWYYVWPHPSLSQPAKMTYLASQKEIMTEPAISLVLANDWTLEEKERSERQFDLANYFFELNHKDPHAFLWFSRAAAMRHPGAQFMVGRSLEKGYGVVADPERARDFYVQAAQNSQDEKMILYAAQQCETQKNFQQALDLYKKAAATGKDPQSRACLIDFYERCETPEAIALALELKKAVS